MLNYEANWLSVLRHTWYPFLTPPVGDIPKDLIYDVLLFSKTRVTLLRVEVDTSKNTLVWSTGDTTVVTSPGVYKVGSMGYVEVGSVIVSPGVYLVESEVPVTPEVVSYKELTAGYNMRIDNGTLIPEEYAGKGPYCGEELADAVYNINGVAPTEDGKLTWYDRGFFTITEYPVVGRLDFGLVIQEERISCTRHGIAGPSGWDGPAGPPGRNNNDFYGTFSSSFASLGEPPTEPQEMDNQGGGWGSMSGDYCVGFYPANLEEESQEGYTVMEVMEGGSWKTNTGTLMQLAKDHAYSVTFKDIPCKTSGGVTVKLTVIAPMCTADDDGIHLPTPLNVDMDVFMGHFFADGKEVFFYDTITTDVTQPWSIGRNHIVDNSLAKVQAAAKECYIVAKDGSETWQVQPIAEAYNDHLTGGKIKVIIEDLTDSIRTDPLHLHITDIRKKQEARCTLKNNQKVYRTSHGLAYLGLAAISGIQNSKLPDATATAQGGITPIWGWNNVDKTTEWVVDNRHISFARNTTGVITVYQPMGKISSIGDATNAMSIDATAAVSTPVIHHNTLKIKTPTLTYIGSNLGSIEYYGFNGVPISSPPGTCSPSNIGIEARNALNVWFVTSEVLSPAVTITRQHQLAYVENTMTVKPTGIYELTTSWQYGYGYTNTPADLDTYLEYLPDMCYLRPDGKAYRWMVRIQDSDNIDTGNMSKYRIILMDENFSTKAVLKDLYYTEDNSVVAGYTGKMKRIAAQVPHTGCTLSDIFDLTPTYTELVDFQPLWLVSLWDTTSGKISAPSAVSYGQYL